MNTVIALRGNTSTKVVDGSPLSVIPFVGADNSGSAAQLGLGYISEDGKTGLFWGLFMPHSIIRSWRAMKLLEKASQVENETLCACWYLANGEGSDTQRYSIILGPAFKNQEALDEARAEVINCYPTTDELETILLVLTQHHVRIDTWELKRGLTSGHITNSPTVEKVLREEQERKVAENRKDTALKSIGVHASSVHKVAAKKPSPRSSSTLGPKDDACPDQTKAERTPPKPKSIWRKFLSIFNQ